MGSSQGQIRDVCIVGAAATPVTRDPTAPLRRRFAEVAIAAMKDADISPRAIDGLVTTPPSINPAIVVMFAAFLAKYLGLETRLLEMVENGGATSALALRAAINEVALGRVRTCLVVAGDEKFKLGGDFEDALRIGTLANVGLQGPYDAAYVGGFPVSIYAMAAQRYAHEYGVTAEDFAEVVVYLRSRAARNPSAQYRSETTVGEVLASPMQSPPLRLLMCCPVSSGAAAVVVTSVEEAKKLGKPHVRIRSIAGYHEPEHFLPIGLDRSFTTYRSAVRASERAYEDAGVGPNDIDVAEIYGVYAPTELMLLEDLGFVSTKGGAAESLRAGTLRVALDPSGGRIAYGHPATATPLLQTVEIVEQLRGRADARQVEGARIGLSHAEHGCLNGSVVTIYEGGS